MPVEPGSPEITAPSHESASSKPVLWGYYDLVFDFENETAEIVPNRSMMFALNIVYFLNNNPAGVSLSDFSAHPDGGQIETKMNITITHPMDIAKFDGYDVRGILIGNGSGTMTYNPEMTVAVEGTDQWLDNMDGFTRWFNPTEFTNPGIFGYTQGILASAGYTGTATVNPYKYFATYLNATDLVNTYFSYADPDEGTFFHGTSATREYKINFPVPSPGIKYGYAIMANWGGGDPQYHPSHCPEVLASLAGKYSNAYYIDETDNGGWVILELDLFDWGSTLNGGVMEDYTIWLESDMFSTAYQCTADMMTAYESDDQWNSYYIYAQADNLQYSGYHPLYIIAEYYGEDYSNPYGVANSVDDPLAGIMYLEYAVEEYQPVPELDVYVPAGGEEWYAGTDEFIGYTANYLPGKVNIFYYKDNDIGNPTVIALNQMPSAEFIWEDIPYDKSDTVKIGVESILYPSVIGTSEFFSIMVPSIEVTYPNGGEVFETGHDYEITWTSEDLQGNVDIFYSKDNFVSDINQIAMNVEDTGSYLWEDVPDDTSGTVKIKVQSNLAPTDVWDVSDSYFQIKPAIQGWAVRRGFGLDDVAYGVARDGQDNYYIVGTVTERYGCIAKYNGFNMQWSHLLEPLSPSDQCHVLDIDINDNNEIYIVGEFKGQVDFDPSGSSAVKASNGGYDAFMVEFDTDGNFQDVWTWGGSGDDGANSIVVNADWDKFVVGYFSGSNVDFDPGTGTSTKSSNGGTDCFMNVFSSGGYHKYTRVWGGSGDDEANGVTEKILVFVTGTFEDTIDLNPETGTDSETSEGYTDVFLSCFISTGTYIWGHSWGALGIDGGESVACTSTGDVFVTGFVEDVLIDFDPDPGDSDIHNAVGSRDAFLSKFNNSGDYLFGYNWGEGYEHGYDVLVDSSGYVFVSGTANGLIGTIDFDPTAGSYPVEGRGLFISRMDAAGNFYWARSIGDYPDSDNAAGFGLEIGSSGSVFMTGAFSGTGVEFAPTDFCDNSSFTLDSTGERDMFLMKYRSDGCW